MMVPREPSPHGDRTDTTSPWEYTFNKENSSRAPPGPGDPTGREPNSGTVSSICTHRPSLPSVTRPKARPAPRRQLLRLHLRHLLGGAGASSACRTLGCLRALGARAQPLGMPPSTQDPRAAPNTRSQAGPGPAAPGAGTELSSEWPPGLSWRLWAALRSPSLSCLPGAQGCITRSLESPSPSRSRSRRTA